MILIHQPDWNAVYAGYRRRGCSPRVAFYATVRDFCVLHENAAWALAKLEEAA